MKEIGLLNIPMMETKNGKCESMCTGGGSNYVVTMTHTTKEE